MSTQAKPIQGKEQVQEREKQKDQEVLREKSVPDVEVKQVRKEQETPREVSAGALPEKQGKQGQLSVEQILDKKIDPEFVLGSKQAKIDYVDPEPFENLREGTIVHYKTTPYWRPNARGQVRAALVLFCYRDVEGKPTGTVNLCIFLNGPMDTGDMGGAKTRCTQFEPGVKFGGAGEPEPGTWSWPSRS